MEMRIWDSLGRCSESVATRAIMHTIGARPLEHRAAIRALDAVTVRSHSALCTVIFICRCTVSGVGEAVGLADA